MNKLTALITGAASGIGRATAIRFAQEGYDVCLNDLNADGLEVVRQALPEGNHLLVPGSYALEETVQRAQQLIWEEWGRVDVLVNCAGLFKKSDPITMTMDQWREVFDIMLNGCLLTSKLAASFMEHGGRIIHITSIHGRRAERSASSYSMAKSAIEQFCRSMAVELADRGILVNAIAPGFVDTAMSIVDGVNELDTEWFQKNYIESHHLPLKRAGKAEEIASVAWFLAGRDSSYITGQVITVDGGLTITF